MGLGELKKMGLGLGKGEELQVKSLFTALLLSEGAIILSMPRTQREESPATSAGMSCPPLALVLQNANVLRILTAPDGEEERVPCGIHLL